MYNQNIDDGEIKTSKYNSGIAQIYRLDGLWKDVNIHSRTGKFSTWNSDLDRIWSELSRDLKDKDYEIKKKEFEKFEKDLIELGNFDDNAKDSFEVLKKEQITKRAKQYKILMEKELFLRRLENSVGKGTAWDEGEDEW